MRIAETHEADTIDKILKTNLKAEQEAVDFYMQIMEKLKEERDNLPYEFLKVEHELRHVIMDEQSHISELKLLLGQRA